MMIRQLHYRTAKSHVSVPVEDESEVVDVMGDLTEQQMGELTAGDHIFFMVNGYRIEAWLE